MGDVERSCDGDSLHSLSLAAVANLAHFGVEILHRPEQAGFLFFAARNAEFAIQDRYVDPVRIFAYSPTSGILLSRFSSRWRADSIFSVSCLFWF
jgi:hypothetical protein